MNILNLFRRKPSRQAIAESKLLFFGKPYDAEHYQMYSELYRKGRRFDGKPCTIELDKLPDHRVLILHKYGGN